MRFTWRSKTTSVLLTKENSGMRDNGHGTEGNLNPEEQTNPEKENSKKNDDVLPSE